MKNKEKILTNIIDWAETIDQIKVIILEGSLAAGEEKDELSDFDINLFVEDTEQFLQNDEWFTQFDEIVVFQKERTFYRDTFIRTRLVIYQNSRRVDFSLWPVSILESWIKNQELPEFYKNGYEILLDKLNIADNLTKPSYDGYPVTKPSKDVFLQTIYNFYFEAAIIAKYLSRGNLWFACKLSNGPIKYFLQQMIIWQAAEKANWNLQGMNSLGKNLEEKISADIIQKLHKTFSKYDLNDCWKSLFFMIEMFDEISKKLSVKFEIEYPDKKIGKVMNYINKIKSRHADQATEKSINCCKSCENKSFAAEAMKQERSEKQ
ncbi:MAG: aminoglycoside 6-adenylyltransferase [Candidatus Cloacimonetes bacterium]|nr:aminoglycoside 6-adenylyltransferase [Candidatus Cloacimonadota bacterium]MCF7813174.1 aminoglycoside 6-adenylyltransferase [Candidatus Cloacimonadota bacterium]MCF7867622.1 aminoglycoside 6-adenylyltransferase [Candidatus Cloacimonadota bacterium]MCF7883103.1 aminoglycoside 6-adenylyltransferase [Candidatus Cloacimonadota bacterium]